jgi:hypothetical protein
MEIINTFKQSIAKMFDGTTSSSVAKHKLPRDTKKKNSLCFANVINYT